MKDSRGMIRTVPRTIELILNSDDTLMVTRYANELICIFAAPLMLLSAFVNYVNRYLRLHEDFLDILPDIIVFLAFYLAFEFFLRTERIHPKRASIEISILLSLVLFFVVGRYYEMMGSAVWTVSFVLIAVSLFRNSRAMLCTIAAASFLCLIYIILKFGHRTVEVTSLSIFNQVFLFVVLFAVSLTINMLNTSRYSKIREQYTELMAQKEEITAVEEELRVQHARLEEYNRQIRESERSLYHLAHHDPLTELPNRKKIIDDLNELIELSKEQPIPIYLVLIDLDNFKKTNDTLGHAFGDLFIQSVAKNMNAVIHEDDILGRIGGDEFALIIGRKLDEEQVFSYIDSFRENLMKPFFMRNREIHTTGSFGISVFPRDGSNAMELFRSADTAMYKAKELGKNNVQLFSKYMQHEIDNRVKMEHCLLNGIRNDEFFLVYQPQYFSNSRELRGFEALLRWDSPEFGVIGPRQFIPLAEDTRLIVPLGDWVLEAACKKQKMLQNTYNLDTVMSVNISTIQMKSPDFTKSVKKALAISRLEPRYLELEITESVFIESFSETVILLERLKEVGVRIALDDFGMGYSSLNYLRRLPLDTLKIDKSFVDDMDLQELSQQIIGDIISIAHHMGLFVIAEGVEHDQQLEYLTNLNCDGIQGFLLHKPLSAEDLEQMLQASVKSPHNLST